MVPGFAFAQPGLRETIVTGRRAECGSRGEAEYLVEPQFANQPVDRLLAVLARHRGQDQARAVAVVPTAEAGLRFEQLPRLGERHRIAGP